MSFKFINKLSILILLVFIYSCQNTIIDFDKDKAEKYFNNKSNIEMIDKVDLSFQKINNSNTFDYYSNHIVSYNFLEDKLKRIKINNYEKKYNNNKPINLVYNNQNIYSLNFKGDILIFDSDTGKKIEKITVDFESVNRIPVSLSLIKNDFIIGFRSGDVVRTNKQGEILWHHKNNDILNTPIKFFNNNLIILYPNDIIILSSDTGEVIFEKNFVSNNIIQSNGGKIIDYFNLIFLLTPTSEFKVIDSFLYAEHLSNLDNIELTTDLNNLNDYLHIYNNYFVYIDNINSINTYDLINNNFLLFNYKINKINSSYLFNNAFIIKNENNIELYNIKNANVFSNIDTTKILSKDSKIVYVNFINNYLHLFTDDGILLILDNNFQIIKKINLKIKKINKIYSYQDKIFISTEKGTTYIY